MSNQWQGRMQQLAPTHWRHCCIYCRILLPYRVRTSGRHRIWRISDYGLPHQVWCCRIRYAAGRIYGTDQRTLHSLPPNRLLVQDICETYFSSIANSQILQQHPAMRRGPHKRLRWGTLGTTTGSGPKHHRPSIVHLSNGQLLSTGAICTHACSAAHSSRPVT